VLPGRWRVRRRRSVRRFRRRKRRRSPSGHLQLLPRVGAVRGQHQHLPRHPRGWPTQLLLRATKKRRRRSWLCRRMEMRWWRMT
jgi:hypothetical protein